MIKYGLEIYFEEKKTRLLYYFVLMADLKSSEHN